MFSVREAIAPYRTSGLEQCEYSCRKWCSTVQKACQPNLSPAMASSKVFWYALSSLSSSQGRGTGIS